MILERVIIGVLSSVTTAIITYLITRSKTSIKKISVNNKATMALLSHHLVEIYTRAEEKGSTSLMDKRAFDMMYESYRSLGGNGFIEDVKKRYNNINFMEGNYET